MTGGNIAAPQYVPEYLSLPRVEQAPPTSAMYPPNRASAEDGIAFGIKLSAAITGTYPLRTFGVLYGESLKRTYDTSEDAWKAVLWPTVSAHWALRRMGLPSGVVTEDELAHGCGLIAAACRDHPR